MSGLQHRRTNWEASLHELRVTQTGTQVMSGFLLSLVFQPRFTELSHGQLAIYLTLAALAALATVLALVPVAGHRMVCHGELPETLIRLTGGILIATTIVVFAIVIGVLALILSFVI